MSPIIDAVGDVSFADANVEDSPLRTPTFP
jgi:hypothetical protein